MKMEPKINEHEEARNSPPDYSLTDELNRIEKLEKTINEADKWIMEARDIHSGNNFSGYLNSDLLSLKRSIDKIHSNIFKLGIEYANLIQSDFDPRADRCMRVSGKLLNQIDAELACRYDFNLIPKIYKVERLRSKIEGNSGEK